MIRWCRCVTQSLRGHKVQWIMDATPKGRFMEAELEPYAQQHVVGVFYRPIMAASPWKKAMTRKRG